MLWSRLPVLTTNGDVCVGRDLTGMGAMPPLARKQKAALRQHLHSQLMMMTRLTMLCCLHVTKRQHRAICKWLDISHQKPLKRNTPKDDLVHQLAVF